MKNQKQTKKICRSNKKPRVWYRLSDFTFVHELHEFDEVALQRAYLMYNPKKPSCKHPACRLSEFELGECFLHHKLTKNVESET